MQDNAHLLTFDTCDNLTGAVDKAALVAAVTAAILAERI